MVATQSAGFSTAAPAMPKLVGVSLCTVLMVLFFLPPWAVLGRAKAEENRHHIRLLRWLAVDSLVLTAVLLVVNLLSIALLLVMPEKTALIVGDVLYYALILVSTPMICGQYWGIGLVGWAALLWSSIFAEKSLKGK